MKLLILCRYERAGASSRIRFYQYLPWLRESGIDLTMAPLLSDAYIADLQNGRRRVGGVFRGYIHRLRRLIQSGNFDLIWIEKDLFPWLPGPIEMALLPRRMPYVVDYDDAVFHLYDLHSNPMVRSILRRKHVELVQRATVVTAGNAYLAAYATTHGCRQVELLPSVVDLDRFTLNSNTRGSRSAMLPCVGWIGQQATGRYLMPYRDLFSRMTSAGEARFTAVGIDPESVGLTMEGVPWSESTEVDALRQFDIGMMPLVDSAFERGKCGYKLIQYMASEIPVVASPVGVNAHLVEHGVNGFLAESVDDWERALRTLLGDPLLRERMGRAGRAKVEREYSLQTTAPRLARLLLDASAIRRDS